MNGKRKIYQKTPKVTLIGFRMKVLYEIDQKMSRVIRFSSAAVGMVLLAGLAYYQTHPDPTMGQEDILIGTAIDSALDRTSQEEGEEQSPDCNPGEANEPGNEADNLCSEFEGAGL